MTQTMLDGLTIEAFEDLVGQRFHMHVDPSTVLEAELTEVNRPGLGSPGPHADGRRLPFSITFRIPGDAVRPQRIYRFEHATLGALDLFAVPIARDEHGVFYEVVFT